MGFLEDGKKVEVKFAEMFDNFEYSSKEEDINEHWDVKISFKCDVKGVKKIRRSDAFPNEFYHFIEIKNVNGGMGWLYGKADFFAFETFKYFIIVAKESLQAFVSENVEKKYVDSADKSLYCLYNRSGRKDVITMVTSLDLMRIAESVRVKNKISYFEIGESVIPEEREKNRLNNLLKKK